MSVFFAILLFSFLIFIHEFGHILGIDDYYDTSASGEHPMEGYDIMDAMLGDHNAFSKFNQGWLTSWKKRGWVKADKKPVLNVELWERIDALLSYHTVRFVWVHGHQGHEYNERCDALATAYADRFRA